MGDKISKHSLAVKILLAFFGLVIIWAALWLLPGSAAAAECPNEGFRTGPSAALPDCRAYELVTPPDTNGRLLEGLSTFGFSPITDMFPTELGGPSGDTYVFMTYNSPLLEPGDPSGTFDYYQAKRSEGGWETIRHLNPNGAEAVFPYPGGFSRDHQYTFTTVSPFENGAHPGGSLAAEGTADYLSAPDGTFELIGVGSLGTDRQVQGRYISEGGEHVIFVAGAHLEPDAPPTGTGAIYERPADGGPTQVVSLLPGDVTPAAGEQVFYQGVSKDASAVAFKIGATLYVRIDYEETLKVNEAESTYAGLSDDGRYLFYVADLAPGNPDRGNIHRFDTETEEDVQVNSTGDAEVVNVSADGSHVYFISESQIGEGEAGKPNMYVWSGGAPELVATVAPSDLERTSGEDGIIPALTRWTSWAVNPEQVACCLGGPGADSSRTTPDGSVLAFESRAQLTSYDNDGHTEIYRYDDGDKSLVCLSCNPLAEPATGDARLQELELVKAAMVVNNLSADGSRVFFETPEALVAEDSDGINDIYQWHQEEGEVALDLISTGQSVEYPHLVPEPHYLPSPNILFSVTPDGENVYFLAQEALVPGAGEGGTPAVYNARVNGGFAQPLPPPVCAEEACKGPASGFAHPQSGPPASEGTQGAGNVKPPRHRPHCQRPGHRKHKHCKKKKAAKRQARAYAVGTAPSEAPSSATTPTSATPAPGSSPAAAPAEASANAPSAALTPAEEFPFEIKKFTAKVSTVTAGMHPDFATFLELTHFINQINGLPETEARVGEVAVSLPPGLLGNVNAIPKCETGQLVAFAACPIDSQVGIVKARISNFGDGGFPIYNLEPPHPEEEIARFGFFASIFPVFIDVRVDTAGDYGAIATVHSPPGQAALLRSEAILWGNPADPSHDKNRLTAKEAIECAPAITACEAPEGKRPSGLPPTVFFSNPSACQPMEAGLQVKSYQRPGEIFTATAPIDPLGETTNCTGLPFAPSFEAAATNPTAGAPSGLKTTLTIPQQSTEAVNSPSTATMREARVTLPPGFQINAGAADGIAACDEGQVGFHQEVDAACPDAAKVGVAQISSPALPRPIEGEVFLRNQRAGHPFGLWLVSDDLGLHVKIPGELEPDKATGRLTAVFADLPQAPVERIELNVWGGARAPLTTPEDCGTYTSTWSFRPHSDDPPVTGTSPITIDQGCGARGFSPKLHAGTTNPLAGAYSPFEFDLVREDSEQNLASLDLKLPDGLLANLAGLGICPEGATASGACPADSRIGSLTASAGAGPAPIAIPQPGKAPTAVYFAGPYKGAPFSIVAVVPAQAGPFDLGNVVVRSALRVDPETAKATVASDPLPQFFEGVGVIYRHVHVIVDRPEFILNPTDCSELQIGSRLTSVKGAVAEPSVRFRVDGCRALGYTPKLALSFKGGTRRSDHPAVRAVLTQPPHQAATARATVVLPSSEFIDQDHINNPCTRVQFAAERCPKLSILGRATAVTPLLEEPLKGPVYFRSNGGERELPDIVADLRGQIHVTLVGFVDAVQTGGTEKSRIRTRFATVPDAPVTRFTMNLLGGAKRGLIENSRDLCRTNRRAKVTLLAQNGRRSERNLLIATGCKGTPSHKQIRATP